METLNFSGMMRNRRLARAMAEAGMAGFINKLAYKCAWCGTDLVRADRWFPASKLCSHCGRKNESLTLNERTWRCQGSGVLHGRDLYSAINQEKAGFDLPGTGRGDHVKTGKADGGLCRVKQVRWTGGRGNKPCTIRFQQILNSGQHDRTAPWSFAHHYS